MSFYGVVLKFLAPELGRMAAVTGTPVSMFGHHAGGVKLYRVGLTSVLQEREAGWENPNLKCPPPISSKTHDLTRMR